MTEKQWKEKKEKIDSFLKEYNDIKMIILCECEGTGTHAPYFLHFNSNAKISTTIGLIRH